MAQRKLDSKLADNVRQVLRLREEAEPGELVFNERVDVELEGIGNGPFRVRKRGFEFVVDEPPERGGEDTGANPLAFFVAGATTCFLSHFMMEAISRDATIDELEATARARFDRRAVGAHLTRVIYDVRVASKTGPSLIEEYARRAEKRCFAHNTLVKAGVELVTTIRLNGEEVVSFTADADHM